MTDHLLIALLVLVFILGVGGGRNSSRPTGDPTTPAPKKVRPDDDV